MQVRQASWSRLWDRLLTAEPPDDEEGPEIQEEDGASEDEVA
jgi:hypothetical protein